MLVFYLSGNEVFGLLLLFWLSVLNEICSIFILLVVYLTGGGFLSFFCFILVVWPPGNCFLNLCFYVGCLTSRRCVFWSSASSLVVCPVGYRYFHFFTFVESFFWVICFYVSCMTSKISIFRPSNFTLVVYPPRDEIFDPLLLFWLSVLHEILFFDPLPLFWLFIPSPLLLF